MNPRYLVFDIESVADSCLVAQIRHTGETIEPAEALRQYRAELTEKFGKDFVPMTFHLPVSLVIAKVDERFHLTDLKALGEWNPEKSVDGAADTRSAREIAKEIAEKFWAGWNHYQRPTFVTFNGRGFDLPLMELTAFRFGIPVPAWFAFGAKSYEQPRNRYNQDSHLDVMDFLTNFGASKFEFGLNIAAKILQKPGKMDARGDMVQDLFDEGRREEIHAYCRCDVLDTYFVFLRIMMLTGQIQPDEEKEIIVSARNWMESNQTMPGIALYLEHWDRAVK